MLVVAISLTLLLINLPLNLLLTLIPIILLLVKPLMEMILEISIPRVAVNFIFFNCLSNFLKNIIIF